VRLALAALVVLVMGAAIAGAGMGEAPAERQAAPTAAAVAAATGRIAAGGAATARGRRLFEDEGCDRCHAIAATGAPGRLGPRLDVIDDDADDIAESIVEPREDIVDGFPEKLMPDDFGSRLSDVQVADLAAFVAAAAGSDDAAADGEDENSGKGRGPGRGGDSGRGRRAHPQFRHGDAELVPPSASSARFPGARSVPAATSRRRLRARQRRGVRRRWLPVALRSLGSVPEPVFNAEGTLARGLHAVER